jgi:hypothetical protein
MITMVRTSFVSESTRNEVVLGKELTANHFLRCMTYFSFAMTEWTGQGKKYIKSTGGYEPADPIDPPLKFPLVLWVEGAIPETFYIGPTAPYTYWSQTWGWAPVVIREGFAVSETSHLFGQYVGQREAARRGLKDLMGTLYTVRHSILNMMSDQERLGEQVKAFKKGNKEQIKGIFVDSYGGQGRTWTEIARNVPMVKSSLSWFYKINTTEEADTAVEDGKLNPVVANYLKRKIQEFETWKKEYKEWLFTAHDRMVDLIHEQQKNEKLYESWAKDSLRQIKRLEFDWDMVKGAVSDIEFSRFAPKAGYHVDLFFYRNDDLVKQLMLPWHPCVCIQLSIFYNPDLQGWKFTRTQHVHFYGAMHTNDLNQLLAWRNLDISQTELSKMMALRAGVSLEEMQAMEEKRQLAKAKSSKVVEDKPPAKSAEKVMAEKYWNFGEAVRKAIIRFGDTFILPFGVDVYKRADSKRMRAESDAHFWFTNYYKAIKGDYGIPHYE